MDWFHFHRLHASNLPAVRLLRNNEVFVLADRKNFRRGVFVEVVKPSVLGFLIVNKGALVSRADHALGTGTKRKKKADYKKKCPTHERGIVATNKNREITLSNTGDVRNVTRMQYVDLQ